MWRCEVWLNWRFPQVCIASHSSRSVIAAEHRLWSENIYIYIQDFNGSLRFAAEALVLWTWSLKTWVQNPKTKVQSLRQNAKVQNLNSKIEQNAQSPKSKVQHLNFKNVKVQRPKCNTEVQNSKCKISSSKSKAHNYTPSVQNSKSKAKCKPKVRSL